MYETIKKKIVKFHPIAKKDYVRLKDDVKEKFKSNINALELHGFLEEPNAKKIDSEIFEIRVRVNGAWRGLYAYLKGDLVVILHIFQKKQNSTPKNELKTAKVRLNNLDFN